MANSFGATAFTSTVSVAGALTPNGGINCDSGAFTVADATGDTDVGGTLDVTGAATLDSTLDVAGATTVAADFTVDREGDAATALAEINGDAATARVLAYNTEGSRRWYIQCGNAAESGSNAGSPLYVTRFDDSGTSLGTCITVTRSSGNVTLANDLTVQGNTTLGNSATDTITCTGDVTCEEDLVVETDLSVEGNTTLGDASTDTITCTGRLIIRNVDDTGMSATAGSKHELVYNDDDDKVYVCTAAGSPATWSALN